MDSCCTTRSGTYVLFLLKRESRDCRTFRSRMAIIRAPSLRCLCPCPHLWQAPVGPRHAKHSLHGLPKRAGAWIGILIGLMPVGADVVSDYVKLLTGKRGVRIVDCVDGQIPMLAVRRRASCCLVRSGTKPENHRLRRRKRRAFKIRSESGCSEEWRQDWQCVITIRTLSNLNGE